MPVKVKAEGKIFTFPDGTPQEEISEAVDDYFASLGPTSTSSGSSPVSPEQPAAQRFTQENVLRPEIQRLFDETPELAGIMEGESPAQAAKVAAMVPLTPDKNELANIIAGSSPNISVVYNKDAEGQVVPFLFNSRTGTLAQVNKPGLSKVDIGQFLGLASAYTPAARAPTMAGAALRSAATEAAIQGAQGAAGGEINPEEVLLSAGLGGGMKGAENLIRGGARFAQGQPQREIVQQAEDAGIPLMTTDVIPPHTAVGRLAQQTGEKIPFLGTGQQRAAQQQAREQAVERVTEQYGEFSYDAIVNSLRNQTDRVRSAAGRVLQDVGERLNAAGEVPIPNTARAIGEVGQELTRPGVIPSQEAQQALQTLIDAINQPQTFTTLKENRTAFREIVDAFDNADRSQLTSRAKALLQRVNTAISDDMTEFARANLDERRFQGWQRANTVYGQEARLLTRTKLKNVLDSGEFTPESVRTMLFSQKPSDVRRLYDNLSVAGRQHARAAIISNVVERLSRRANGITPNSFATEMNKMGLQTDIFFRGEERRQLEGLLNVLNTTRRAQDAAVATPTGQQLLPAAAGAGLMLDLFKTGGAMATGGTIARVYESAPVRDILLRIASVPAGSTRMDILLRELSSALESAAQAQRSTAAPAQGS